MKNILKILFLIGLSGNFLIAAKMYKVDDDSPGSFTVTSEHPPIGDAYRTVGVTIAPFDNLGTDEWVLTNAKLNPVHLLNNAFFTDSGISGGVAGHYYLAQATASADGKEFTYKKMVLTELQHEQYTGQPLFMLYDAWSNHTTDYKGTDIPTGEAVLRFFPVLDMAKFTDNGGAYFDYHYKVEGQSTWTKCNTITSGPNGALSTEADVFGDLTDHLPVETIWDAKTDLGTDFNENIVVRIRAKYGTAAFTSAPTDSGPSSPSPGSGGAFVLKTGGTTITVDNEGAGDVDSDTFLDGKDKIIEVIQTNSLTKVGTYDDGVVIYDVYDFPAAALGSFLNGTGKPAGTYAVQSTGLVQVELSGAGGS
jgi:hypothetical protein